MASRENFSGNEKYVEDHASGEEKKLLEISKAMVEPRPDYKIGNLKLHFESILKGGDEIRATENENGMAKIVIERNGQTILDFKDFLAAGYKMVTPSYLVSHPEEEIPEQLIGTFAVSPQYHLVLIGDIRDEKDLLPLLHEIGHIGQGARSLLKPRAERGEGGVQQAKDYAMKLSWRERDAWTKAIVLARRVKKENGVDLLEPFDNFDELKRYMYAALLSHRYSNEYFAKEGEGFSEEDMKVFEELYDKGKFGKDKPKNQEE